ncbi:MAG TPA: hypothetical protein VND41_03015 [Nitrososphaerales archaeon]|nr:hypothetical protein [Nitrososphaerales archaeon]
MAGTGVATTAVVAVVVVVLVGAGIFGYMFLMSPNQSSSTTQSQHPNIPAASTSQGISSTNQGNLEISNAALSNNSLLVTIQNTGSQPLSISSLLVTRGSGGCLSTTTTTSQASQNRSRFALPACFAGAAAFLVQSNSTLRPVAASGFNFTRSFNSTRSFSRSGNFSRTISGNFSRTFPGNFSGGFPGGFFGNFSGLGGFQLTAGQAVTLAYSGAIGSGVTAGSQYTITVTGQQADAQITLQAS